MKTYNIQLEDGAIPASHEIETAIFLIKQGKSVKFLAPKNQNRIKTPDILMDGMKWEIKAPVSNGSRAIEHAFRQAIKQSPNVIFDLRNSRATDSANLVRIKYQIKLTHQKSIKNVLVITKSQKMLDLEK